MAKLLSGKGLTATTNIGSPPQGMKWIVKWVLLVLHTGSTTGSRSGAIVAGRANYGINVGTLLAFTGGQTGTDATYYGVGDVTNSAPANFLVEFYAFPEVFSTDVIQLVYSGQNGDTVDYYIMIEEVIA